MPTTPVTSVSLSGEAVLGLSPLPHVRGVSAPLPETVKLGRLVPKSRPQTVRLESFVDLLQTTPKPAVDWYTKAQASISRMYLNDRYGDCVFAGKGHALGIWSANDPDSANGQTVLCTDQEISDQYFSYTGGRDTGAVISQVLDYMVNKGFTASGKKYKITGYVSADWRSKELTQIGLDLFGCASIGINLPNAWTSSAVWDVTNSGIVGGHDVTPCFTGDTKVSLLDGTERTLKELAEGAAGEEFWVYSCDTDGNVVPGRAHSARKTGVDRDLVRVTLDNGEQVRCTTGHEFMLRDGTYKRASDLVSGDSLMPLYRKLGTGQMKGYERVYNPATKKWRYTHRVSAAHKHGGRYHGEVVHHVDFDKTNNVPENLEVMSWDAHTKLHNDDVRLLNEYARSPEGRAKSREVILRLWADPVWREKMVKQLGENGRKACLKRAAGGTNGFQKWTDEDHKRAAAKSGLKLRGRKQPAHVVRAMHDGKEQWLKTPEGQTVSVENQHKATAAAAKRHAERGTTDAQREARRRNMIALHQRKKASANNHKVVSVEPCGREDVYDITVDDHHNFALTSGVFVHNCGYGANVLGTNADGVVISSWGRLYLITWAAWVSTRWLDELYFMVPEFLWTGLDQRAPSGVDIGKLKEYLSLIGGGTVPPLPDPTPPNPPTPPVPPSPPVPPVPVPTSFPNYTGTVTLPWPFGDRPVNLHPVPTLRGAVAGWQQIVTDLARLMTDIAASNWNAVYGDVVQLLQDFDVLSRQKGFAPNVPWWTVTTDVLALIAAARRQDWGAVVAAIIKLASDFGLTLTRADITKACEGK